MITLILAAGTQKRWRIDNPMTETKQLVDIGGKPLLERTLEKVQRFTSDPVYVITHRDDLPGNAWMPANSISTLHTLRSTHSLWGDVTVVLLGDVVYSNWALATIYLCDRPVMFFGRDELRFRPMGKYYEMFAVKFTHSSGQVLWQTLHTPLLMEDDATLRLRNLYDVFAHLPPKRNQHERTVFYPINDWTEDIDCYEDYVMFCEALNGGLFDASC